LTGPIRISPADTMHMAKSFWDPTARQSLLARLGQLRPDAAPQWGRFTAHGMVVHLVDAARMALGAMPVRRARGAAARELLASPAGDWNTDVATFTRLAEQLAMRAEDSRATWPEHPFFGPLTRRDWGVLGYRHTDHHLRQFGV